ncbi:MAG: ATP-binding protein [Prolixibacteraceae bacterium]|nr:ATP-binding protein [Prolixibacteraceae bacterium]
MLLETIVKEVIDYQREVLQAGYKTVPRKINEKIDLGISHINILSGIRRSGKSTIMMQLASKVEHYYYMNFEDPRLVNFEVNDFFKLEKLFKEYGEHGIFFFDEIQNINGWERYVRILHDKKEKVVITGSNASLLSKEFGTSLTGRQLTYEVYPFSFQEFLDHEKLEANKNSFELYLNKGGFPEFLQIGKRDVLLNLFNDIVYRDIVVRHGIRNARFVRELGVYLATNVGKEFSYNKLAVNFNLGSVNTVLSYISYFEDSYLFFTLPRFSYSLKKQSKNLKKIYCIDTGMISNLSTSFSDDKGWLMENIVFIELKRRAKKVYYYKNKQECDFIAFDGRKGAMPLQVCYELNDKNMQREISGLLEAMNELSLIEGIIVTFNQEDFMETEGKRVNVIPAWKWLMEEQSD